MKIYAINGSPRRNANTGTMCKSFLDGVQSINQNVEVEQINLGDLTFRGCISCFACKRLNSNTYGTCPIPDDLFPLWEKIYAADGLAFASPVYFGGISSLLHCFMERLCFQKKTYEKGHKLIVEKRMPTVAIITMNETKSDMEKNGYEKSLAHFYEQIEWMFSKPEVIYAFNTYQTSDYSKYNMVAYSEKEKAEYKKTHFPLDCKAAYDAGATMIKSIF